MNVATALARGSRGLLAFLAAAALGVSAASEAVAQGVTTGAVRGRVTDTSGQPVAGATVTLVNRESGLRFLGASASDGRFFIANVVVGPYSAESRAIGFRPARDENVRVSLGAVAELALRMEPATVELEAITVAGEQENPMLSASRTGATSFVSDSLIRNLPSLNRNFTDFIQTVPQVVGNSVSGQNNRFNNIQIDGGVNNDLFGLAASGTPGGQANARPISVEAVQEFQVLIAPFDVRQGGFTGGLINAVTRSGTNRLSGSLFGYFQNQSLVGDDTAGTAAADFDQTQYGFTVSGPIVRDRLTFFVAGDLSRRNTPFAGQTIGPDPTGGADSVGVGITGATADRVRQIAVGLGFDPGGFAAPVIENPDDNIFLKLTGQIGSRGQMEVSFNRVDASDYTLIRNSTATGNRDGYQLANSGYNFESVTNTLRGRLNTPFGSRYTNELLLSYQTVRDERALPNRRPLIFVGGDRSGTNVAIGADRFSHANSLDQDIIEVTNNLTIDLGRHTVTVGTHNEFFGFRNVFFPGSLGIWSFPDTAAFAAQTPTRFERAVPGASRPDGPVADFDVSQLGFYVQDQYRPDPRLSLTFGLRFDYPSLPSPVYNATMDTTTLATGPRSGETFGIRTDQTPTDQLLLSPRFGFSFDPGANGRTYIRGGVGVFSGRPPYVWVSNAFANTGLEQASLVCTGADVPVFTVDPDQQPSTCGAGATAPRPSVVFYEEGFRFPQTMRLALGLDRQMAWDMVGTVDFQYTRTLNSYYLNDANLIAGGVSVGEAQRPLYGTMSGTGSSPRRMTTVANDVLGNFNENRDYSWSLTFELNKRFSDGLEFKAGYSYSETYDLISMTSSITNSNFRFATLDGTLDDRNLRRSVFDVPHKVTLSGTARMPYGFLLSLIYNGRSGAPFAYTVSNDANGDGQGGNDLVYVPLHVNDIQLSNPAQYAQLDAYIQSEQCLRDQRGRVMERNSCRNPWRSFLNARLAKTFTTFGSQQIELTADMFNVLSFLGVGGNVRETAPFEGQTLLFRTGYNAATQRGIYSLSLPVKDRLNTTLSRWRLVIGGRYLF